MTTFLPSGLAMAGRSIAVEIEARRIGFSTDAMGGQSRALSGPLSGSGLPAACTAAAGERQARERVCSVLGIPAIRRELPVRQAFEQLKNQQTRAQLVGAG